MLLRFRFGSVVCCGGKLLRGSCLPARAWLLLDVSHCGHAEPRLCLLAAGTELLLASAAGSCASHGLRVPPMGSPSAPRGLCVPHGLPVPHGSARLCCFALCLSPWSVLGAAVMTNLPLIKATVEGFLGSCQ